MTGHTLQPGQRVYHRNRGWGTYLGPCCHDTSRVHLDSDDDPDQDWEMTTALLLPVGHPDCPPPPAAGSERDGFMPSCLEVPHQ